MAYATLAALKAVLFPAGGGTLPDPNDGEWQGLLDLGAVAIDRYCRRTFTPTLTPAPVLIDAPAAVDVAVPDVLGQTTLTAYGTPLTRDTDYRLLTADVRAPYRLTTWEPHFTRIRRLSAGHSVTWQSFAALAPPEQALSLTFLEGYSLAVPGEAALANLRLGARLWEQRLGAYAGGHASPAAGATVAAAVGLISGDADLLDLLHDLRREDT